MANLSLDTNYCLICLDNSVIVLSYFFVDTYRLNQACQINFSAMSSDLLLDLICQHKKISQGVSLSHAFYIAQEVYKAELSKSLSQSYTQS